MISKLVKADQLADNFSLFKKEFPSIAENIQNQINAKLEVKGIIQLKDIDTINSYMEPVLVMLNQYALEFSNYLQSVENAEKSNEPDTDIVTSIRDILSQVQEFKEDFIRMKHFFNQQAILHNMALNDFRLISVMETFPDPEPLLHEPAESTLLEYAKIPARIRG